MNRRELDVRLRAALGRRDGAEVLALSNLLVSDPESHDWGVLVRGMAYELGGGGLEQDLGTAEAFYRKAAALRESAVPYVYLARVLLKLGADRRADIAVCLRRAAELQALPEVDLAYAAYYEAGEGAGDSALARRYYWRAAGCGRLHGFFGYARVCRRERRWLRALAVDCLRLVLVPVLLVFYRRTAAKGF